MSPVLFCVYLDELLQRLHESGVGCYIGSVFVGALAYADDIALLAPTPSAMRRLLKICDTFGTEFSVAFNSSKSACVVVSRRKYCFDGGLQFTIGDSQISVVNDYVHLGLRDGQSAARGPHAAPGFLLCGPPTSAEEIKCVAL